MATPWIDPNTFGAHYGGIVCGLGGALGGLLGAAAGTLAPRGKGRRWILGAMSVFVALGVAQLILGAAALILGQPFGIWYPLLLCGVLFIVVIGGLLPVVRRAYEHAEHRRIDAAGLRRS